MSQELPPHKIFSWFISELSKGRILMAQPNDEYAMFTHSDGSVEIRHRHEHSANWRCVSFVSSLVFASQLAYKDLRNYPPTVAPTETTPTDSRYVEL